MKRAAVRATTTTTRNSLSDHSPVHLLSFLGQSISAIRVQILLYLLKIMKQTGLKIEKRIDPGSPWRNIFLLLGLGRVLALVKLPAATHMSLAQPVEMNFPFNQQVNLVFFPFTRSRDSTFPPPSYCTTHKNFFSFAFLIKTAYMHAYLNIQATKRRNRRKVLPPDGQLFRFISRRSSSCLYLWLIFCIYSAFHLDKLKIPARNLF